MMLIGHTEVKLDGFRIIAIKKGDDVKLFTRAKLNYSEFYHAVIEALKAIPHHAVFDGEIVVLDEKGRPNLTYCKSILRECR
jgi:bifunctional non-homologous end joining protein LigD